MTAQAISTTPPEHTTMDTQNIRGFNYVPSNARNSL